MEDFKQELLVKIKTLSETVWEGKAKEPEINEWLENFDPETDDSDSEHLHALYLLSNFMYFGNREIRELLKALYRDLYKYPIIESIRKDNNDRTDADFLTQAFERECDQTRFLGIGNPSESGSHLLYYFRQENALPKDLFIYSHQIFSRTGTPPKLSIGNSQIKRYVFIDDLCGSGSQAKRYSREILEPLKQLAPNIWVAYYTLFATKSGLDVLKNTLFDDVDTVFEFDDSNRCLCDVSRYFPEDESRISRDFAKAMCLKYGERLYPAHPLGWKDGQLLVGFHHNTPNNTLPIIWYDEPKPPWKPIFRRYPKIY